MRTIVKLMGLVLAVSAVTYASLIPIGFVSEGGTGLGNVDTILTIMSPGATTTATGCVGLNAAGNEATGSGVCPAGFTGGNEQAINNTYAATDLFTDPALNFANIVLMFNPSEPPPALSIRLDNLALVLYAPTTGTILESFTLAEPFDTEAIAQGTGQAGWGFALDPGQSAAANAIWAANPGVVIGAAANVSDATGGPETFYITTREGAAVIPEPMSMALFGTGLLAIAIARARKARRTS
jgi:hypothetical protein